MHFSVKQQHLPLLLPALAESSLGVLAVRASFALSAWADMVSFDLASQRY
jgi:hypothetical protein